MTDRRTIALPDTYTPAAVRDRWNGCTVEVLPVPADSKGQLCVRFVDGPGEDCEIWLPPMWLRLPEIETAGDA